MVKLDETLRDLVDREFIEKWSAVRARGRIRFAVTRGVLAWGGLMLLAFSLGQWIADRLNVTVFLFLATFLSVGGFIGGVFMWNKEEARYSETKHRLEASANSAQPQSPAPPDRLNL